jgi:hypothetical protein
MFVLVASCASTMKYGFVRAKSWMLRLTLGSCSMASSPTAVAAPVRFGLMISSVDAVTVIVSETAVIDSPTGTSAVPPRGTVTLVASKVLNPSSVAVTLYGPPTRTFGIVKRPFAPLTVS